jgi:fatty acid desaturase
MIILILSTFYAFYFFYLYKWVQSRLSEEYNFGSPSPPKPLPHSPTMSIFLSIIWGVIIFVGIFWGFTYNRYPDYLSIKGSDTEIWFLIAIFIALGLTFIVVYHIGEIKGITSMKNTKLFKEHIDKPYGT